jgi:thiol:disulfide interchange protein DsbD
MKNGIILSILFVVLTITTGLSQILQPVKWSFDSKRISEKEAEVIFKATIDPGWHVYSNDLPEGGPIPTSFNFTASGEYELKGKITTPKPIEMYDKAFEMDLRYFNGVAEFTQRIALKTTEAFQITGELEFMACDDSRCLPPEYVEFSFQISEYKDSPASSESSSAVKDETIVILTEETAVQVVTPAEESAKTTEHSTVTTEEIKSDPGPAKESGSLWAFFFIALGVGFVGLLTPCVYPMIPMTITFFMNASQNKLKAKSQAIFFGLSIIFIYTFIGVLVSVVFGADTIKQVSEHWITNILFFLLFAIFAASFFGMFELVLPAWLTNKSDRQADRGGYIGAFFMALTLVLVSFSCTAPFVGGILVEAATGEVIKPIVGMFGFSLAFGVVFTILALFPAWLNKMPRSGGWLNSVKVVLAFLILAIGMKYLLVPNQALGWGITREVYLGVWIILFTLLGFYLLGKIQFSHDSPVTHVSVPRLLFVIAAFTFALYLVPGLFGAPLKAVSGYIPSVSSWDLNKVIRENIQGLSVTSGEAKSSSNLCEAPKYADLFELPHGLEGYFDYEQGMACARKLNKPVFLDIKGHACTNCKVMEKNVWSDPQVLNKLREEYVVIALYVDDNFELPEAEWVTSTFDGKVKKTIGRKNTDFQITRYGVNAQPYYVLLDLEGNTLIQPIGFEPDIQKYAQYLDAGVKKFNEKYPQAGS